MFEDLSDRVNDTLRTIAKDMAHDSNKHPVDCRRCQAHDLSADTMHDHAHSRGMPCIDPK